MTRSPRPVLAALAAALVATAGCTLPVFAPDEDGATGPGPAGPGSVASWRPCDDDIRARFGRVAPRTTYECATVRVPRDWNAPQAGPTYGIAAVRIRSQRQTSRIGSLLVNPGGPGGSGIELAVAQSFGPAFGGYPREVTERFDVVGFDPRGVGQSDPVRCIPDADQDASFGADPDPGTQAEFDAVVDLNRRIAAACAAKYPGTLQTFSTEQAARDMEVLRIAVGDEKTTYLGYSYGTLLGATYAQLFPDRVRALVLDGAVDPQQGYEASSENQARGFERAFTNFATWCRGQAARCPIAPDARARVTEVLARADTSPLRSRDGRAVTRGWILTGVGSAMYSESSWPSLARSIASLRGGDPEGILDLADSYARRDPNGRYTNLFDANLAVNCADAETVPSVARVRTLQAEWRGRYPLFGSFLAMGMLPCVVWQGRRDAYPTGAAAGAPPIVVVGTTGDPATPYENTAKLASMLGVGRVLTWEGEGHTAYPTTTCIADAVNRYLIDLRAPREGLRCPAR